MPAYFDTGFCVRVPSWHHQELLLQESPETWDEGRLAAGLMWEPRQVLVYRKLYLPAGAEAPAVVGVDGQPIEAAEIVIETHADGGREIMQAIPNLAGVERDDTNALLGVRSREHGLITHAVMGEFHEVIQKEFPSVKLDTMGSCRGGRQVWSVLRLDEPFRIGKDESDMAPYISMLNNHAGSGTFRIANLFMRTVCANTFQGAESEAEETGRQIVIRHTGDMTERIEQAKEAIAGLRYATKQWQLEAEDLYSINVDDSFIRMWAEEFIPAPVNATERGVKMRQERRDLFVKLYEESPTLDGCRGTAYGIVQATGEYLDHLRSFRSVDTYLARTLFGEDNGLKRANINRIRELATSGTL